MRFYFLINNELLEKSIDFILSWGLDVRFRTLLTWFYIPHFLGLCAEVIQYCLLSIVMMGSVVIVCMLGIPERCNQN